MVEIQHAVTSLDPVWDQITTEAQEAVTTQPLMGGLIHALSLIHISEPTRPY